MTYVNVPRAHFFFWNTLRKFLIKSADSVPVVSRTMKSQNPAVFLRSGMVSEDARGAHKAYLLYRVSGGAE